LATRFLNCKKLAVEKNQLILLNFSSSDWCGPRIRMKKEIFGTEEFSTMADSSIVFINADFARNKIKQLSITSKRKTMHKQKNEIRMANFHLR